MNKIKRAHKCTACKSLNTKVVDGVSDGFHYYDYVDCMSCGEKFEQDSSKIVKYSVRNCEFNGVVVAEIKS